MSTKFKVGNIIEISTNSSTNWVCAGEKAKIVSKKYKNDFDSVAMDLEWLDDSLDPEDGKAYPIEAFILVKGGKNVTVNEYKVFKTSCNNYEETLNAKNDKEAIAIFRKKYKTREGFYITKTLVESVEKTRVVFK